MALSVTYVKGIHTFRIDPMPLEECLSELEKYGDQRVSKIDGDWHSSIKVFVTGEGVAFDVKSSFKHTSAKNAANQCYQRLAKALEQIKKGEK